MARNRAAVLAGLVLVFGAGCLHVPTTREREDSMKTLADVRFSGSTPREYLRGRLGYIFQGAAEVAIQADPLDPNRVKLQFPPEADLEVGSVVAIDRRGYFLTARHVLGAGPLWLLFHDGTASRLEKLRLVWEGDPETVDLAVVHVFGTLGNVWSWSGEVKVGEDIIGAGPRDLTNVDLGTVLIGGKVLGRALRASSPPALLVAHNAPLRSGDSGGPLLNRDGQLVAINTSAEYVFHPIKPWTWIFPQRKSIAVRPEVAWLGRIIERDARIFAIRPGP